MALFIPLGLSFHAVKVPLLKHTWTHMHKLGKSTKRRQKIPVNFATRMQLPMNALKRPPTLSDNVIFPPFRCKCRSPPNAT